jgi:hypothetical protein
MQRIRGWSRWIVAVAAAVQLAACVSVGDPFSVNAVRRIEIGRTTQEDVRRMFGEPWRTGVDDGQKTWTYGDYRYSLFSEAKTRDLVVRFDDRGIVRGYTFNSTHPEDRGL